MVQLTQEERAQHFSTQLCQAHNVVLALGKRLHPVTVYLETLKMIQDLEAAVVERDVQIVNEELESLNNPFLATVAPMITGLMREAAGQ